MKDLHNLPLAARQVKCMVDFDETLSALLAGAKKHDLAMMVGAKVFTYDLAAIYGTYAEALRKHPDELTMSERQQALLNHVLEGE